MIDPAIIDEVKRRTNIATVIGKHTTLKRSGKNLTGLCPFHQEKSPSFSVSEAKGVFYCFGCQANGDVIKFIMMLRGLSFYEVLEDLAREAGVLIPQRTDSPDYQQQKDHRRKLAELQALVAEFYHRILLKSSTAEHARTYLAQRHLDSLAVSEFRIGYAPDEWSTLVEFLRKKGVNLEFAAELGLITKKNDYYDMFRNRLLFPIVDPRGDVIGFGGRALGADEKPKYLNSPESLLFKKGQTLYGLPQAISAMGREGYVIFVEGYVDLIALWQVGIRNVVAPLGTALTRDHLELVQRYTGSVLFLFDGDAAGEKASQRAVELVLEVGIPARMVKLEGNLDPDDFIAKHGGDVLRERLKQAKPLVGYFLDRAWESTPKDAPGIANWVRSALDTVARLRDSFERGLYLKSIADRSNFSEENLRKQIAGKLVQQASDRPAAESAPLMRNLARFPNEEVMVIKLLLHYPRLRKTFSEIRLVDKFSDPLLRRAASILVEGERDGGGNGGEVGEVPQALYAEEELAAQINRWQVEGPPEGIPPEAADQTLLDALSLICIRYLEDQVRSKKLQESLDDQTMEEVMRLKSLTEMLKRERSLESLLQVQ